MQKWWDITKEKWNQQKAKWGKYKECKYKECKYKESKHEAIKYAASMVLFVAMAYVIGASVGQVTEVVNTNLIMNFESQSWGLGYGENGATPTGNTSADELAIYDAFYVGDETVSVEGEKVLYITFDAGYENGNTEAILDALEKHNAPATFFIVGYYLEENPELVLRMIEEGHTIGNHSYNHPDMTALSEEEFIEEMESLEELYLEVTGMELSNYYRPPQGKYSVESLKLAQSMGYETIFWSLAYVDWYQDDQPTHDEAFDKLLTRVHPGAIVLLHSTSQTNAEILDELLTKWEEMGYVFKSLDTL